MGRDGTFAAMQIARKALDSAATHWWNTYPFARFSRGATHAAIQIPLNDRLGHRHVPATLVKAPGRSCRMPTLDANA
jgi:hypothetical protein